MNLIDELDMALNIVPVSIFSRVCLCPPSTVSSAGLHPFAVMGLVRIVCLHLSCRLLCDAFPVHCHLNITNLLDGVEQVYLPPPW